MTSWQMQLLANCCYLMLRTLQRWASFPVQNSTSQCLMAHGRDCHTLHLSYLQYLVWQILSQDSDCRTSSSSSILLEAQWQLEWGSMTQCRCATISLILSVFTWLRLASVCMQAVCNKLVQCISISVITVTSLLRQQFCTWGYLQALQTWENNLNMIWNTDTICWLCTVAPLI